MSYVPIRKRRTWCRILRTNWRTRNTSRIRFYLTVSELWTTSACRESSSAYSCLFQFWLLVKCSCTIQLADSNFSARMSRFLFWRLLVTWASRSQFVLKSCLHGTVEWHARSNSVASIKLISLMYSMQVCSSPISCLEALTTRLLSATRIVLTKTATRTISRTIIFVEIDWERTCGWDAVNRQAATSSLIQRPISLCLTRIMPPTCNCLCRLSAPLHLSD